ncbi:AAA family ATPase [Vibrio fluvialis]|nr:AAA family ATPase [Vibrio fluvialis]
MSNLYIKSIKSKNHPFVKADNIDISSTENKKKDIIITGINGSGKTTLLTSLKNAIATFSQHKGTSTIFQRTQLNNYEKAEIKLSLLDPKEPAYKSALSELDTVYTRCMNHGAFVDIKFSIDNFYETNYFVLAYFEAKRVTDLSKPKSISAPTLNHVPIGNHNVGKEFIQHLVNRRSQQSFAFEDGDKEEADKIKKWFNQLDTLFSGIFGKKVKLAFRRNDLYFVLEDENKEQIDLIKLSDGYSAIISIVCEIITRMEAIKFGSFDVSGIVLIDEIETHLHVSLQRQILPFLSKMFPNIQFIVTTHSPFILSSVDDAIIYDLESGDCIDQEEALWAYSYEALVDGYFETERFSIILEKKVEEYERLSAVEPEKLSRDERKELRKLTKELENVPLYKNETIELKLKQLGLR